MDELKKLEILRERNKFMLKMCVFSITLSLISNVASGLPWSFIAVIACLGGLILATLVFMEKREKFTKIMPIFLSISISVLTFFMIYSDQHLLTYFTTFFNILIVSFYKSRGPILLTGALQVMLTLISYFFFGKNVFPGWGVPELISLVMYIVLFSGLLVYQAVFFNRLQTQSYINEKQALVNERKTNEILKTIKNKIVDEFSKNLQKNIEKTGEIANNISHTFTGVAKEINHQFSNIEDINNSVQSTNQSVSKATFTAENMKELARENLDGVVTAEERVVELYKETEIINQIIESTVRTMESLNKENNKIGSIISAIEEIADKTKYLSINAAIEATKTGEVGKGFSVVASEVGKLAEEARNSATEISKILKEIKQNTVVAGDQTVLGKMAIESIKIKTENMLVIFNGIKQNTEVVVEKIEDTTNLVGVVENDTTNVTRKIEDVSVISQATQEHIQDVLEIAATQKQKVEDITKSYQELEDSLINLYEQAQKK